MSNTSGNPTWRDMNRESPAYFAQETRHEGYPEPIPAPVHLRLSSGVPVHDNGGFRAACTFALRHPREPELRLHHGSAHFGGASDRTAHAWVELANNVTFDGETQAFYLTDQLRTAGDLQPDATYTAAETARLVLEHGDPGPWPDTARS